MWEILVIGNGFDIAAGLESSFESFMEKRIDESVRKKLDDCRIEYGRYEYAPNTVPLLSFDKINQSDNSFRNVNIFEKIDLRLLRGYTFWDFLFYFQKNGNFPTKWCDVEAQIKMFLEDNYGRDTISYRHLNGRVCQLNCGS